MPGCAIALVLLLRSLLGLETRTLFMETASPLGHIRD
jgi:hypothetical protein